MAYVLFEKQGDIGIITMNRPEALNALNADVLRELEKVVDQVAEDDSVSVVIITGSGRSFVAGADIGLMAKCTAVEGRNFSFLGNRVFSKIEKLPQPVIAAINGFALGGGCELSLACDIRIASTKAKFGAPETGLAIIPGFGGTQRFPRTVGAAKAKELIFTAETIDAKEAERIGLVSYVVEPDELMPKCMELAQKITRNGQIAVRTAKRCINAGLQCDIDTGTAYEVDAGSLVFSTEDKVEAMTAFMEKRPHAPFKNR
jgi:enoyl-CoA hydratase